MEDSVKFLRQKIRSINDFPKPGIIYRDITTLLQDAEAFARAIDLCSPYITKVKKKSTNFIKNLF